MTQQKLFRVHGMAWHCIALHCIALNSIDGATMVLMVLMLSSMYI
jgi:hypothetical protein